MLIQKDLTLQQKLEILSDAAKYDVACTSSGVDRGGKNGTTGSAVSCGICHSFAADGRCVSLLKILMTNACIHDCRYCINRISNDTVRTYFTPEEICTLTMEFYRRNYIEGLFLSSGILHTPNETMERMYQTLWLLREEYGFWGYIHVKAIPGADPVLIEYVGHLADRMSVNLELPTVDGLKSLAPAKSRKRILSPMRQIQNGIRGNHLGITGEADALPLAAGSNADTLPFDQDCSKTSTIHGQDSNSRNCTNVIYAQTQHIQESADRFSVMKETNSYMTSGIQLPDISRRPNYIGSSRFVPAGQSTQMIIGATPETDYQILSVTEALYRQFDLKRVFFSAYTALNDDSRLPALGTPPPLLREHRLYQADWLLRYYGFSAGELLSEKRPHFNLLLDPKCDWALRHLEKFPVEVSRADYATLLRIPGIGVKSARRILKARRHGTLNFDILKKIGVVLKRAGYFITCEGHTCRTLRLNEDFLTGELIADGRKKRFQLEDPHGRYRQLSLFDDFHLGGQPEQEDILKSVFGQL